MNGLEAEFSSSILHPLLLAREVAAYAFEPIKLRLADRTWYAIDFLAEAADGTLDALECKGGHWEDDARAKWKIAAETFPCFRFFAITKNKGGIWHAEPAFIEDRAAAARYGALRSVSSEEVGGVEVRAGRRKGRIEP